VGPPWYRQRKLALDAPPIDPVAIKLRAARQKKAPPLRGSQLDIGSEHRELAADRRRLMIEPDKPATAAEARRARELALTERLERRFDRER